MTPSDFSRRCAAAAQRWADLDATSPPAAEALVFRFLAEGLPAQETAFAAEPSSRGDALLALECALVRAAGEFDEAGYRLANPAVRPDEDPVRHFCREGWRGVRNPHAGFDVWWYVTEYLDPADERINPYVHYLLVGRHAGLRPMPPFSRREPTRYDGRTPRRICLFAGYDVDGMVDDYVVAYLAELSRHADVYYLADGLLPRAELERVRAVTRGAWSIPHGEYDFGSYSRLARDLVGWDAIADYDELLLVNDSCYLVRPLDDVFEQMDGSAADWWGLQLTAPQFTGGDGRGSVALEQAKREFLPERVLNYHFYGHVGSYFLAFRVPVIADAGFRRRIDSVRAQRSKLDVIFKYEAGTTRYLVGQGFDFTTYVPDLYPYHPAYGPWTFDLIARGFPLLKRGLLAENPFDVPDLVGWRPRLQQAAPDADVDTIERNLLRVSPADALARSLAVRTTPDGVEAPRLLTRPEFRAADRAVEQRADWWAFPVRGIDGAFAGGVSAVFDAVRDDPAITKVVLTGSRVVTVAGPGVESAPLRSEAGQRLLMQCRYVFTESDAASDVPWPLPPGRHHVISLWTGAASDGERVVGPYGPLTRDELAGRLAKAHAVASAGGLPVTVDALGWATGVPAWDRLVGDLPKDLQTEVDRLRDLLNGVGLALVVPLSGSVPDDGDVERLLAWARTEHLVLGLRESPRDRRRWWARALAQAEPLDLSWRRWPELAVLLRTCDVVVTDDPAVTAAAAAAGVRTLALGGLEPVQPGGTPTTDGRAAQRLVERVRSEAGLPSAPVKKRSLADVWRRARGR